MHSAQRIGCLALVVLAGCQPSLSESDTAGPDTVGRVASAVVEYDEACAYTHDDQPVTVEGVLHLKPLLLYCSAGGNALSGRACQLKLLPDAGAPTGDVEIERRYFTAFIEDGRGPSQLDARGYGSGYQPVRVLDADSVLVGPTDRVRVTGTLRVRDLFARDLDEDGNPIGCSITEVYRVERMRDRSGSSEEDG